MKTFYHLLANSLVVAIKNNFVWFALTFWAYLTTKSVVSTGVVGGTFLVATVLSNFWFGTLVDHHRKKMVMLFSNMGSLAFFIVGLILYQSVPAESFSSVASVYFWVLVVILLIGTVFGNIYAIAIPTLVSILVPAKNRDKANGMFGTVMGVSFAVTSIASGVILGNFGMYWVILISIILTLICVIHLLTINIKESKIIRTVHETAKTNLKATFNAIKKVPGLFALIFFTTFNNLVGGVFMALMDAYGLTLVSVQVWGTLLGILSFGFIFGGLYISKYGLGSSPLRNLFNINIIVWVTCIFFPIQPSIILLSIGFLVWMALMPFVEATEQTIIQKVVPVERQGRVFGFAHTIEQASSPITAFLIGPIAQFVFIPFMTTGAGVDLIGDWFGVGPGRGMALVFILSGFIGLAVTLIARRSNSYVLLAKRYQSNN